jgi:hypothetical protein
MALYLVMSSRGLGFDFRFLGWLLVAPRAITLDTLGSLSLCLGLSGRSVKLMTHINIVLRLRIRGPVLPLLIRRRGVFLNKTHKTCAAMNTYGGVDV